jgi:distribution and morphology protein 10
MPANGTGGPSIWNLMLSMNHDTGKWSQQYSYSTEDGLFGARVLHNFPTTTTTRRRDNSAGLSPQAGSDNQAATLKSSTDRKKRIDEEEVMDNVLKGRFSVGGELYFSAQRKSAGGKQNLAELNNLINKCFFLPQKTYHLLARQFQLASGFARSLIPPERP